MWVRTSVGLNRWFGKFLFWRSGLRPSAARAGPLFARSLNFFGKVVIYEGILRIVDNSGLARAALASPAEAATLPAERSDATKKDCSYQAYRAEGCAFGVSPTRNR